jgi:hypothetical protein
MDASEASDLIKMNLVKPALIWAFLAGLGIVSSQALVEAAAQMKTAIQNRCAAETARLRSIAEGVRVTATVPNQITVGESFEVAWEATERFPQKEPVYAVVAVEGEFRIQAPPSQHPGPYESVEPGEQHFDLPGIVALPADARGPLGIAFGAGHSRIFVPLYQPGSKLIGQFAVRPFTSGTLSIRVGLVARTGCGESLLRAADERKVKVGPGEPLIVVQDPYDTETPKRVIISNSGRYRIHVDNDRYRVFETATGAKLVDRAGYDPNFSPHERFVVASTLADRTREHGPSFEVVDLVSLELIDRPSGPVLGWTHNDAFLLDGHAWNWGAIRIRQTLISRANIGPDQSLLIFHNSGAHQTGSWDEGSSITVDLDNAVAVVEFLSQRRVIEIATGYNRYNSIDRPPSQWLHSDREVQRELDAYYAVAPAKLASGWRAREEIRFSHTVSEVIRKLPFLGSPPLPFAQVGLIEPRGPSRSAILPFAVFSHKSEIARRITPAQTFSSSEAGRRGDWRTAIASAYRGALGLGGGRFSASGLQTALDSFGLTQAPPTQKESMPYSDYAELSVLDAQQQSTPNAQLEAEEARMRARSDELVARMVGDVPALPEAFESFQGIQVLGMTTNPGCVRSTGLTSMLRGFDGVWRWQTSKGAVWLYQCVTNWGASDQGALNQVFVLDGRKKPGTVIDLLAQVEGLLGNNNISIDAAVQQGRLIANLYLDRFLVLAARAHRTIAVYDLDTAKTVLLISDAPQAELIEDVVLTADMRHAVQLNRDGQFFIHELAAGSNHLNERQMQDQKNLYTPDG